MGTHERRGCIKCYRIAITVMHMVVLTGRGFEVGFYWKIRQLDIENLHNSLIARTRP